MKLPRDGREPISWPVNGAPDGLAFQAQFINRDTTALPGGPPWVNVERSTPTTIEALVAGPDVDQGPAVAKLPLGRTMVKFRFVEFPQIVVRGGGAIDVE